MAQDDSDAPSTKEEREKAVMEIFKAGGCILPVQPVTLMPNPTYKGEPPSHRERYAYAEMTIRELGY